VRGKQNEAVLLANEVGISTDETRSNPISHPTKPWRRASIITRACVRATKSDTLQRWAGGSAESETILQSALVFPKLASNGFNVHLAAPSSQNESCRVRFEKLVGACIQYAFSVLAGIERSCSIESNHAEICLLTGSYLTTRVAIAGLGIVRAHFNKRSARACSKADHHLNISNMSIANSNIGKVS